MKIIFENNLIKTFLDNDGVIRMTTSNTLEGMLEYAHGGQAGTILEMAAKILELTTQLEMKVKDE